MPYAVIASNDGTIRLTQEALGKTVTIRAYNPTITSEYTFKIDLFFELAPSSDYYLLNQHCTRYGGKVPTHLQLSTSKGVRQVGSLWGEWSKPNGWPESNSSIQYWSSTQNINTFANMVDMNTGDNTTYIKRADNRNYWEHGACVFIY